MKKQTLPFLLGTLLLVSATSSAQQSIQPCDTYAAMEQYFSGNPEARTKYEKTQHALETEFVEYQKNKSNLKTAATEFTIPVVFHILHTGGTENISDALCTTVLNQVNSDLAKMGADANTVAPPFNNLYIPSDIKLMLAKKDPNGNCTNGVVHHYDSRTVWDRNVLGNSAILWAAQYNGITWNTQRYLNIIIVKSIVPAAGQPAGVTVVGYTFKPGAAPASNCDAVVYTYSFLNGLNARQLTHELGHWLNLNHTFGANNNNPGVNCDDDGLQDTPPTKGYFTTCPSSASGNPCSVATPTYGAGQANVENIMDYSSCPKNFTGDQTDFMRTALGGSRSVLVSAANLSSLYTDVNNSAPCAPKADFHSSVYSYTVCKGGTLIMRDYSYNGTISTYQWAADNSALVASPNASNTSINFPVAGTCSVTLTVSNAQGSNSLTKVVTVVDNVPGMIGPILEGFENGTMPADWSVHNPNSNSVTWEVTNQSSYEGTFAYYINNFGNQIGHEDVLTTPIIDLANNPGTTMSFQYAYARYTSTQNDQLAIQASKDCGGTWQDFYTMTASIMANGSGGVSTSPFFPQPDQWKMYDLSLHPNWSGYTNSSSVKFRFKYKAAGPGNYIYIDAVNLNVPVGINELTRQTRFNIAPNPSNGAALLNFVLDSDAAIGLKVYDVSGRVVESINTEMSAGDHTLQVNGNSSFLSGIYIVELSVNGARMSKKLLIE